MKLPNAGKIKERKSPSISRFKTIFAVSRDELNGARVCDPQQLRQQKVYPSSGCGLKSSDVLRLTEPRSEA
jgi:hypothetical protein